MGEILVSKITMIYLANFFNKYDQINERESNVPGDTSIHFKRGIKSTFSLFMQQKWRGEESEWAWELETEVFKAVIGTIVVPWQTYKSIPSEQKIITFITWRKESRIFASCLLFFSSLVLSCTFHIYNEIFAI